MSETVKAGDQISIEYTGRFEDGTVFDSSEGRGAFSFEAGGGNVIPGMDAAVVGMQVGEEKTVEIPPEEAYGPRVDDLVISVPSAQVPEGAKVGDALSDGTPNGPSWVVTEVGEEAVTLDGNHPLSGQMLIFDIKLVAIG